MFYKFWTNIIDRLYTSKNSFMNSLILDRNVMAVLFRIKLSVYYCTVVLSYKKQCCALIKTKLPDFTKKINFRIINSQVKILFLD